MALLLGALHPLGSARDHVAHVCGDAAERHVEAEHHSHHDATTCALCHLAHEAQVLDDLAPLLPGPAFLARAVEPTVRRRAPVATPTPARPRAPPCAPAVAS
jgi:hypothetical protein